MHRRWYLMYRVRIVTLNHKHFGPEALPLTKHTRPGPLYVLLCIRPILNLGSYRGKTPLPRPRVYDIDELLPLHLCVPESCSFCCVLFSKVVFSCLLCVPTVGIFLLRRGPTRVVLWCCFVSIFFQVFLLLRELYPCPHLLLRRNMERHI